jgi:ABC-type dipeptide/oligopeptide/nickel transport system ATPase component
MSAPRADAPLLKIENLSVAFRDRVVAENVNFTIERGETQALVGESGSGKSVTALSILKLLPYPAASHPSGRILFRGEDLLTAPPERLRKVRGGNISIIFQEPMTSLNPVHRIERQLVETLTLHRDLSRDAARKEALELLHMVQIRDAAKRLGAFPHELSGGQRQRVMIAMALANKPDLLIADEPTTAVDVTIQAQIMKLLRELQEQSGMAILLISHDLALVRKMAREVAVMQQGKIVEQTTAEELFKAPRHPYTKQLLAAQPRPKDTNPKIGGELIAAKDLKVWFPIKAGIFRRVVDHVKAVDGVSVDLREGETVGIVGESGSGKTSLALGLLRRAGLHHLAVAHDDDPVAHGADHPQIVADEEIGEAVLLLQVAQQIDDLRLHRHVEGRGRLVQHDQLRFQDQGAGDGDALPLPAGKFMWIAVPCLGIEADLFQRRDDRRVAGVFVLGEIVDLEPFGDDLAHRQTRRQRAIGVLEDDLHFAPDRAQLAALQVFDIAAHEHDRPVGLDQAQQAQRQAGLARA